MLENLSEILSILAAVFGIISSLGYFSQVYKIIKRKSSADVSLATYIIFSITVFIWFLYGISLNNFALIITNIITLIGAFSVIVTYFKYKK